MKNLTAQDAQSVVQIIDLMTQRGAVRGDELAVVATIRQKFYDAATQEQKEPEPVTMESKK